MDLAFSNLAQTRTSPAVASNHVPNAFDAERQPPPRTTLTLGNIVTEFGRTSVHVLTESGLISYEESSIADGKEGSLIADTAGRASSPVETALCPHDRPYSDASQFQKERSLLEDLYHDDDDTIWIVALERRQRQSVALQQPERSATEPSVQRDSASDSIGELAYARLTRQGVTLSRPVRSAIEYPSPEYNFTDNIRSPAREPMERDGVAHDLSTTKYTEGYGCSTDGQLVFPADTWISPKPGSLLRNVSSADMRTIMNGW